MAQAVGTVQVWDRFLYLTRPNPVNPSLTETWAILGIDLGFDPSEAAGTAYLEGADSGRIVYFDAYQHQRVIYLADTGLASLEPSGSLSIDPTGWLWYKWGQTKRALEHADSGHGDAYTHDDAPEQNTLYHADEKHQDHNDTANQHSNWSDHDDTPYNDYSDHQDRAPNPHKDWSDTYSDTHANWSDHGDQRYSDTPPVPHYNWSDTHFNTHSNWTDSYTDTHRDWSDTYYDTWEDWTDIYTDTHTDHYNTIDYPPYDNSGYSDAADPHQDEGYQDWPAAHQNSGYDDAADPHGNSGYDDAADPHENWSDSYTDTHTNWSDHDDASYDDEPDPPVQWTDRHDDWSDHNNTPYLDQSQHDDIHFDYTDHADLPYADEEAYSDAPHLNWSDHNDGTHADNPRFLGYDLNYKDWSDHNDLVDPHGDWNDHIDQGTPLVVSRYDFSKTWNENEPPYPFREILPSGTLYPSSLLYPSFRPDLRITWVAWGNGSSASSGHLGNELGRVPISMITQTEIEIYSEAYIGPEVGEITITEIGWFGGDTAGEDKDSGVMLARESVAITKASTEALLIIRTDTRGW